MKPHDFRRAVATVTGLQDCLDDEVVIGHLATLTQVKEAAEAALLVKEAENQKLRGLLQKARDTYPCNICGWPRPFDAEHNICKCCGYQPGYDDPAIYKWDGAWWSRSAEGKPQILLAMEATLARLTAYVQHKPECRYRECAKCGYSDRLLHDVTSTAPLRHPFVSVGCTCGLDTLPSTGQASGRTPGEVQAVIDEMTEALGSGAFFNPEMFGSMLKPGDNPILRWRDTLLAAQAGRTPQKENER